MLLKDQHPLNKSIMVSVLGNPNAGKSSLINYLLGFDLSIVTHKPQTTRNRFHCTLTIDHTEIVLVDTPGVHTSNQEFNKRMNDQAQLGSEGCDVNLLLIDLSQDVIAQYKEFFRNFETELGPTWVVFTKSDLVSQVEEMPLDKVFAYMQTERDCMEKYFVLSAENGDGVHLLTAALCDKAQPGPHFYPGGEVSNKSERFFVCEYIREQAFNILQEELPYEVAVVVDDFHEFGRNKKSHEKISAHISASIYVNRPSQRAIVVGSKGSNIKTIGMNARKKIEQMIGGKVHLNLHVKVVPKWFKNNKILEDLGLPRCEKSNRVWRARV